MNEPAIFKLDEQFVSDIRNIIITARTTAIRSVDFERVKMYWKLSERLMVKHSDLLICDSKNIEKYIHESYEKYNPKTTFIAYGAETGKSSLSDDDAKLLEWYRSNGLSKKEYYLVVKIIMKQ